MTTTSVRDGYSISFSRMFSKRMFDFVIQNGRTHGSGDQLIVLDAVRRNHPLGGDFCPRLSLAFNPKARELVKLVTVRAIFVELLFVHLAIQWALVS